MYKSISDVCCTLDEVRDHVTSDDYNHIKRILLDGCPAHLIFEEPSSNKLEFISCGYSKSFVENLQLVQKTMNKEDRYSHLVPMDPLLCKLSPYLHHTMQHIVGRQEQSYCMGWIYIHSAHRYSYEPGHTSHPRSTSDLWSCQKPDLHGHLQHTH
jgi:hypothetical protein